MLRQGIMLLRMRRKARVACCLPFPTQSAATTLEASVPSGFETSRGK